MTNRLAFYILTQRRYFERRRKQLFAKYNTLKKGQKEKLEIMFWYSDELRIAYLLKEQFDRSSSKEAKRELKNGYSSPKKVESRNLEGV
jgi:hypothetical protein